MMVKNFSLTQKFEVSLLSVISATDSRPLWNAAKKVS